MRGYNYLYAGFEYFCREIGTSDTRYTAVLFTFATQALNLFAILAILSKVTSFDVSEYMPRSKYSLLVIAIPWLAAVILYYSKSRQEKILAKFNSLSKRRKDIAFWAALFSFFGSLGIMFIFLNVIK